MESRTCVPGECPRWALTSGLFAAVLIAACSQSSVSKTTIAQYDRMPGYDGAFFTSLLVIGVGENDEERRFFEDVFCRVLSSDSAYMLPSWKLLPESRLLTETELKGAIGTNQFDGVLTIRLVSVDEDEDEEQVEGKTSRAQRARPFERYYQGSYEVAHEPGYYERATTYRFETNLHATRDSGLVWSAHSVSVDPGSVETSIESLARAVGEKLREEGLIRWGLFTLRQFPIRSVAGRRGASGSVRG